MDTDNVKAEIANRYEYLYENAVYILAPYMHEDTDEELRKLEKQYNLKLNTKTIGLRELDSELLYNLEEFLMGDSEYVDTVLYGYIEDMKINSTYMTSVNTGLSLLEKGNARYDKKILHQKLDIWTLLEQVYIYISKQNYFFRNKKLKLNILDEYFRIARYSNDGLIWTSGYILNSHDSLFNFNDGTKFDERIPVTPKPSKDNSEMHTLTSAFIDAASKLNLTEKEKQDIYLKYHDELPWDLMLPCENDESHSLPREKNNNACHELFNAKAEEMIYYNGNIYQKCPNCGYMVKIPRNILSPKIINDIKKNSTKERFDELYFNSEMEVYAHMTPKRRTRSKNV